MDGYSLSPLLAILFNFCGINSVCLSLMIILSMQVLSKLHLKDNIKLNLTNILGVSVNNTIEYYINKIITSNLKIGDTYI